jgi:protein YibB
MYDVSIVTAFYDIGRGQWTADKGLPGYLHRPMDVYLQRFKYLTKLENNITVITAPNLVNVIAEYIGYCANVTIIAFDLEKEMQHLKAQISLIQTSDRFKQKINPMQLRNPEYWSADYVLVTGLKAFFVQHAIELGQVKNDTVAWIDFGYCRSETNVDGVTKWTVDFDPKLIHLFNYKDYTGENIATIVSNNDVYILGAKVVANKSLWYKLNQWMLESQLELISQGLVDDDQGLWLNSYINHPQDFEMHRIPDHQLGHDPFVLFKKYNTSYE